MKRFFSLFLAVMMIASIVAMLPVFTVSAEDAEPQTVTPIATADEFVNIFSDKTVEGGYYKLTANIDLTASDYTSGTFSGGTLDGGDKTLTIDTTLFTSLSSAVKNLTLEGSITLCANSQGALAYYAYSGASFDKVTSNVAITYDGAVALAQVGSDANIAVGGFVGTIDAENDRFDITNCKVNGDVTIASPETETYIGGIFGCCINTNGLTVDSCAVTEDCVITVTSSKAVNLGGIAGKIGASTTENTLIQNCFVAAEINHNNQTRSAKRNGGIVGYYAVNTASTSLIDRCVFTGQISLPGWLTGTNLGGFVGNMTGKGTVLISDSVMAGTLSGSANNQGVCVGYADTNYPFTNCISLTNDTFKFNGGNQTGILTNCYGGTAGVAIETIGEAFILGSATYQKYNFGYLDDTTKALVSTNDALKPTDGETFGGYLSLRDRGENHDMRILLATDVEAFTFKSATVSLTFKLGETVVKTLTLTLGGTDNEFVAYKTAVAAGERYFAEEGYELLGVVITDIPDGAWDTLLVTVIDDASNELYSGGVSYTG